MRFTTYQPNWAPIRQFQRELDRVWDNYQELRTDSPNTPDEVTWAPVVDVKESASQWLLLAELPGVNADNIDITAEKGFLVIQGEKKALLSEPATDTDADNEVALKDNIHRQERVIGRFYRRFSLPKDADTQKITAASKDGVLSVSIPKQPELMPTRIEIQNG